MINKQQKKITEVELKNKKIAFISLGCDKNRIDLEEMMYDLSSFGFSFSDIHNAEIVIINTCAFILPARKESIENIMEMAQLKETGVLEKIVVTGCLCQRFLDELKKYMPEVDEFVEIKNNKDIVHIIANLYDIEVKFVSQNKQLAFTPRHYAYLKIADGCNNCCAFCTIPRIRGRYISIPFNDVISRAKQLVANGAKELIIVAQDITRYGLDLYDKVRLVELLKELSRIKNLKWIRLHYCYPELVDDNLLEEISTNEKICPYIDIPLQHIDDKILKNMNRRTNENDIRSLIEKIKSNYPEISIRSTFMVGFPGETRKAFNKLIRFLEENKLDNVGFFAFSREEGTKSFYMKKQIKEFIKRYRLRKIQKIQNDIADEKNQKMIGRDVEVLVDRFNEKTGFYEARTNKMSPEVDYFVNIENSNEIIIGDFVKVNITGYENYSFTAKVV